jgi:hypothetical protein
MTQPVCLPLLSVIGRAQYQPAAPSVEWSTDVSPVEWLTDVSPIGAQNLPIQFKKLSAPSHQSTVKLSVLAAPLRHCEAPVQSTINPT